MSDDECDACDDEDDDNMLRYIGSEKVSEQPTPREPSNMMRCVECSADVWVTGSMQAVCPPPWEPMCYDCMEAQRAEIGDRIETVAVIKGSDILNALFGVESRGDVRNN